MMSADIFAEMQRLLNGPAAAETEPRDETPAEIAAMTGTMPKEEKAAEKLKLNRRTAAQVRAEAAAKAEAEALAAQPSPKEEEVVLASKGETLAEQLEKELVQETPKPFIPGRIVTLFIDCLPVGCAVTAFSLLLADATKELGDYRLGAENEYGRGAGRLLNAIRTTLAGKEIGALFIESSRPESAICLAYLESITHGGVIRGIR
jgi:hypothetical protein